MGKSYTKTILMSGLAAIAFVSSTAAYAQAGNEGADGVDIIVTARRTEERLQDVPISISVISQEQITARNLVMGSDLAVYTPSLTVNQRFGPETSAFAIRGFTQEANTAPSVGVYFAEVTTPRSLGLTAAGSNLAIGSMMDLQNIQVLKGPQGTLFGINTTGGAILLEPKRPTDKLEGYVEGSAGDYGMLRGQAVLNIPISDNLKVRLDIDRMKRDGYMKNRSGIGPDAYNDTNYVYARMSVLANLSPNVENYTVLHYSKSDTNGFASRIVTCARTLAEQFQSSLGAITGPSGCTQLDRMNALGYGPLDTEVAVNNPYFKIKQWQLINHATWQASDNLRIKNIASYARITSDLDYNLAGENLLTQKNPLLPTLTTPFVLGVNYTPTHISQEPGYHSQDQWTFTDELQFQGKSADGRLNWQAGGYISVSKSPTWNAGLSQIFLSCTNIQALQCFDPFGFGQISHARIKSTFINKAVYAQASYKFSDHLSATGGIRYTWDTARAFHQGTRFFFPPTAPGTVVQRCIDTLRLGALVVTDPVQCSETFEQKSSKPTWNIDLDYKPSDAFLLYAKWSRGYRAGNVAPSNVGNETWGPEKLEAYEVGVKASFYGAVRGYVNAAAFYNDFSDQQLVTTTQNKSNGTSGGNAIVNAGKSTIKGFEVDAAITLFDSLDLSAGYAYLDTKIKELVIPDNPIFILRPIANQGDPLAQVPKNRLNLSAKYTLPLDDSIGKISIGATYVYTDKAFFNLNSTPSLRYLPASNIVNLNVDWKNVAGQPIDAAFFVTNLTNKVVPVVNGGEWASYGYESVQYGAPRMWGARLRYKFGQ